MRSLKIFFGLAMFMMAQATWADEPVIAVVVPAQSALAVSLNVNDLALVFWRKKLYNGQGKPMHPANLAADHPLRQRFSQLVLHSSPKSQVGYWNGLYFNGIQPPFTVQSEEAMLRYVADTHSAVGYVSACKVDERVRPILWLTASKVLSEPPPLSCDTP